VATGELPYWLRWSTLTIRAEAPAGVVLDDADNPSVYYRTPLPGHQRGCNRRAHWDADARNACVFPSEAEASEAVADTYRPDQLIIIPVVVEAPAEVRIYREEMLPKINAQESQS
jgi:hypothetical protein